MPFIKKNSKYITLLISILLIIFIINSLQFNSIKTDGYSVDKVYNTINELSSEKYKGRRFGTQENLEAVRYVEGQFKSIGLKPVGDNSTYLQNYMLPTKVYTGIPILEVVDENGNTVKRYESGEDFFEDGRDFSKVGDITSSIKRIYRASYETIEKTDENTLIAACVLTKEFAQYLDQYKQQFYIKLNKAGYKAFVGITRNNNANFRKISAGLGYRSLSLSGYEIPNIIIKERISDEIFKYINMGYKIHLKTVIDIKNSSVANVMGMIPGNTDEYVFITSHIDHVGETPDGVFYPGALDNASGVGAMLEVARFLASQGKKPEKNIVFVAFNAEEAGALGSKQYIKNPTFPLHKTTVINLDMIGADKDIPLSLVYYYPNGSKTNIQNSTISKLLYQLKTIAKTEGISVTEKNEATSDNVYFNFYGVSAITLNDDDTSKIHLPIDNINNVNKNNIHRTLKLVTKYISLTSYSSVIFKNTIVISELKDFINKQYFLLIFLFAIIILVVLHFRRNNTNSVKGNGRIPLLSILLIILLTGIISYFPICYPYAPNSSINALKLLVEGLKSIALSSICVFWYVLLLTPSAILIIAAKHRMNSSNYKGKGDGYNIIFYISIILIIVISVFWYGSTYGKILYYANIPGFARSFIGKCSLHLVLGAISFGVWKLFNKEARLQNKSYLSMAIYGLIFFTLVFTFYRPISYNKYSTKTDHIINLNDSSVSKDNE